MTKKNPFDSSNLFEESLEAKDWDYLAEGKLHIVIQNNKILSIYHGLVMKIPKLNGKNIVNINDIKEHYFEYDQVFIENVITKWFPAHYISGIIGKCSLNTHFLKSLLQKVNAIRPKNRKSDESLLQLAQIGYLERNVNFIILRNYLDYNMHYKVTKSLSFELKVKCGIVSSSPFIKASHRGLKLSRSRYQIMQLYKLIRANNKLDPSWGDFRSISKYNPNDIFSNDQRSIRTSLEKLFENPQNNLKVSFSGNHIYGWDKNDVTELMQHCNHFFTNTRNSEDLKTDINKQKNVKEYASFLLEIITYIIYSEENLFKKLNLMQKLDVLDIEGTTILYSRLIELCGSSDEADSILMKGLIDPLDLQFINELTSLLQSHSCNEYNSKSVNERNNNNFFKYFLELLSIEINPNMSEDDMNIRQNHAFELVGSMDVHSCVSLLKLWMISLIAKDISIVIVIEKKCNIEFETIDLNKKFNLTQQSDNSPGCIMVYSDLHHEYIPFISYSLKLIDIGMKPLSKFWKKYFEDQIIWSVCSNLVNSSYDNLKTV